MMGLLSLPTTWLRDEFRLSTWLLTGAFIQFLLVLFLPKTIAILPTALILFQRVIIDVLRYQGLLRNPNADGVLYGGQTVRIPNDDGSISAKPSDKGVVILVLGFSSSHPLGRLGPGVSEVGTMFNKIWRDASKNRETSGYLGRTPALLSSHDEASNTMLWLSYWKSLEQLRTFTAGDTHRKAWNWYYGKIGKNHPHIGLMHETFVAPAGSWETIYYNFKPFAMGSTKYTVKVKDDIDEETNHLVSGLESVKGLGKAGTSMYGRMDRVDGT